MLRSTLALLLAGLALGGCAAAPPPRVVYVEAHAYPPPAPGVVHVEHHHHDVGRGNRYAVPPRAVPPPHARGPRHGALRPHAVPPPRRPHGAPPPRLGTRPVPPDKAHPNRPDPRGHLAHKPKRSRDATKHDHKRPHVDREKDSAKR